MMIIARESGFDHVQTASDVQESGADPLPRGPLVEAWKIERPRWKKISVGCL